MIVFQLNEHEDNFHGETSRFADIIKIVTLDCF